MRRHGKAPQILTLSGDVSSLMVMVIDERGLGEIRRAFSGALNAEGLEIWTEQPFPATQ